MQKAFMAKKIRNPQMAAFKDGFVLHGRSGNKGEGRNHFVLYTSHDGVHWDAGRYLRMGEAGAGAYSNNLIVHNPLPRRARTLAHSGFSRLRGIHDQCSALVAALGRLARSCPCAQRPGQGGGTKAAKMADPKIPRSFDSSP